MGKVTRRDFIRSTAAAAGALAAGGAIQPAKAAKKSATDWVPLGNSGVEVTRLAFGTGTFGGRVQRELAQEEFNRLVRHAYDRGVRFFESADGYHLMHERLAEALKGIPRDSYRLMTKYRLSETADPWQTIDRYRKELNTDYLDILLLHCVRTPDWPERYKRLRDVFEEAKQKKIILAHGASCHGLLPLRQFPKMTDWLDVALLRINHDGTRMDALQSRTKEKGDVDEVVSHIARIHSAGVGVIGMKVMGEGRFRTPEQRDQAIGFVMRLGTVDSITIGYKAPSEIDEAIERIGKHLNT